MRTSDKVRFTNAAISQCRNLFGRHARLQAADREKVFTVVAVKPTGEPDNAVIVLDSGEEWAEKLLEHRA